MVHAIDGDPGALLVLHPELAAVVVAKDELVQVALEVLLPAVLIDANHAALEDAEEPLNRVGGDQIIAFATSVFLAGMIDRFMGSKLGANRLI